MVMVDVFDEASPRCLLLPESHRWPIRHTLTECLLLSLSLHVPVADDLRHHRNPHLHLPLWHHHLLHRLRRLHHLLGPIAHPWPIGHALTECLLMPLPVGGHRHLPRHLLRLQLRDFNHLLHHLVYHFGHMPHHLLCLDLWYLHDLFHSLDLRHRFVPHHFLHLDLWPLHDLLDRLSAHLPHVLHHFLHLNLRNLDNPFDSLDLYFRHLNDPLHCLDLVMLLVSMVAVMVMVVMVVVMVVMVAMMVACAPGGCCVGRDGWRCIGHSWSCSCGGGRRCIRHRRCCHCGCRWRCISHSWCCGGRRRCVRRCPCVGRSRCGHGRHWC